MAIVAPVLLFLMVGAAQAGTIAYGNVTMDTAAREGARVAIYDPRSATNFIPNASGWSPVYRCVSPDLSNTAVAAVCSNTGMLDNSKVTVQVRVNVDPTAYRAPGDVVLVVHEVPPGSNPCTGNDASIAGTVSFVNLPAGAVVTVQGTGGGTLTSQQVTSSSNSYSLCVNPVQQTVSAKYGAGCTGYSASVSINPQPHDVIAQNFTPVPNPTCPPPTPTPTPTPAPTPTPGPTPTPTASPTPTPTSTPTGTAPPTPPPLTCTYPPPGLTTGYVQVRVTFPVPIFVPLVDRIFSNGPGVRTVTIDQTMRIEPCWITG